MKGVKPTCKHIAQPYYADGVQECIVVSFGGNAHVDKPTPGSRRHEVNTLSMFEFGKQLVTLYEINAGCLYDTSS